MPISTKYLIFNISKINDLYRTAKWCLNNFTEAFNNLLENSDDLNLSTSERKLKYFYSPYKQRAQSYEKCDYDANNNDDRSPMKIMR